MKQNRCAAHSGCLTGRRDFIRKSSLLGTVALLYSPVFGRLLDNTGLRADEL